MILYFQLVDSSSSDEEFIMDQVRNESDGRNNALKIVFFSFFSFYIVNSKRNKYN